MLRAPEVDSLPGRLADNVLHFARVLRHATLAACFVDRGEHRELFDQAFYIFWKDPDLEGRMRALLLPQVKTHEKAANAPPENRRLAGALFPHMPPHAAPEPPREQVEVQAAFTFSDREILRQKDFETLSSEEWRATAASCGRCGADARAPGLRRWWCWRTSLGP